jgi:hypothetical protein
MIEGPMPEQWGPPGIVVLHYVSPDDGSFWNVSRIVGTSVQLWTGDCWATVKTDSIKETKFREKWREKEASEEISPGRKVRTA